MSVKYERVKKSDEALPAPLRMLTRAFSSITLAVCFLAFIGLYGVAATIPVSMLAMFGLYVLAVVCIALPAAFAAYKISRGDWLLGPDKSADLRGLIAGLLVGLGIAITGGVIYYTYGWATGHDWFFLNRAKVIYRLPFFEMTELEFYSWWPMRLVLVLFVINMIWATVRRIEFKFVNIGVLTVHTGIVILGLGSVFYGQAKVEGDTILWRDDLGGRSVSHFYDATEAALYLFSGNGGTVMVPLPDLPRYNDYRPDTGSLEIPLHTHPGFAEAFGPDLRATITGFYAYGELTPHWVDADETDEAIANPDPQPNPAIRVGLGDSERPIAGERPILVASVPAERVYAAPRFAVELLNDPGEERITNLLEKFEGQHGLVVEIPSQDFRQTYSISQGQTIQVGDTGYAIEVQDIGAYDLPFVSEGYQGASDTRAMVTVTKGPTQFRRIVMHRYPERSQDFVPAPNDPNVGPMGRRTDPDPAIKLTYLDGSITQYHLIAENGDPDELRVLVRLPASPQFGNQAQSFIGPLSTADKVLMPSMDGSETWLHLIDRFTHATQVRRPTLTPRDKRNPKDEGTYVFAMIPVDLELPGRATPDGEPWRQRLWLNSMRYPMFPDNDRGPVATQTPDGQQLAVAFSRTRHRLPFSLHLNDFSMTPYPGSDIPKDFASTLTVTDHQAADPEQAVEENVVTRMNNPAYYHGYKISQSGWDPGDAQDPNRLRKGENGQFLNQQRYSILGIGNNQGIYIIALGACLVVVGIPWAFYVKPWLLRRQRDKIKRQLAAEGKLPSQQAVKDKKEQQPEPAAV